MIHSERKSILCPNCRRLISSYENRCPYCGIANPASPWKRGLLTNMLRDPFDMIQIIIYVNVALYIFALLLDISSLGMSMNPLVFLSPSNKSLFFLGATGTIPILQQHWWWTLVSASYLHGGLLHIFFNMMALRQLGPFVIHQYGVNRFFAIYTVTGIAGFFISFIAGIPFTIGASASICGLIGATLYYGKSRGGTFGQAVYRQVMGWVIGLALFGFLVPGINNWGHGGGIAAGILMGFLLGYTERHAESNHHRVLAIACVILTVIVLAWAILQSVYYVFLR